MSSDQIAAQPRTGVAAPRVWRMLLAARYPSAVFSMLQRVTAGLRRPPQTYPPDPFATEMPFLDDSWPREQAR
ncbi:MAG: hypothetical protein JOZ87_28380 [Chloroflexi bacterium]|nr:hypothetical protein [Chloroflexota bacterium]